MRAPEALGERLIRDPEVGREIEALDAGDGRVETVVPAGIVEPREGVPHREPSGTRQDGAHLGGIVTEPEPPPATDQRSRPASRRSEGVASRSSRS